MPRYRKKLNRNRKAEPEIKKSNAVLDLLKKASVIAKKLQVNKKQINKSNHLWWFGIIRTYPPNILPITLKKWRKSKLAGTISIDPLTWSKLYKEKADNDRTITPLTIKSQDQFPFLK